MSDNFKERLAQRKRAEEAAKAERRKEKLESALMARGAKLRSWRMLAGFQQVQLAKNLGVHWNTVANWENGTVIPRWALEKLVALGWPESETLVSIGGNHG